MANGVTRDVKMVLGVETLGVEKFSELEKRLRDLAKSGEAGAEDFGRLADQISKLGEQNTALQAVKSLSAEFADLTQRQQAAAEKVQVTKAALDQLATATNTARTAQEQARSALVAGEQAYVIAGNAIRAYAAGTSTAERQNTEYRAELQRLTIVQNEARTALIGLREENRQAGTAAAAAAAEQRQAAAALAAASREQDQAATAANKHAAAMRRASQAAETTGVNVRDLAAEEQRLRSAFGSATQAAAEQQTTLEARKTALAAQAAEEDRLAQIVDASKTRQKLAAQELLATEVKAYAEVQAASARATTQRAEEAAAQAAEEDRLAQIVDASKTRQKLAAQELLATEVKAYAEVQAASARATTQRAEEAAAVEAYANRTKKALSDAFSTTGVRSTAAIEADILQVNQSLLKLASNAKVSGADFDRAFVAGQARIATLRAEMDGTGAASAKLEASTKTLAGEFKGLVAQLGGVYVAFQAGGMFVAANSQAETFARTMTLLTSSSEKAAAEMEYVRGAANRLGLEVQTASKSYTQLVAATKGTAMEGESARKVFEAVSGAMASLGKSSSETNDALRAVNQMASKGTVQMEELKGQLGEALPGAMKAAANGAGLTVAELTKMVETGGVLAEDLLPALAKGLNEMYKTGTTNNDTFVASWARLKNAVTDTFQVIGDTGLFRALVVVVEQVGIAIGGLTGAFVLLGKTFGITAGAIATFDWKHPIDSMVRWRDSVSQAADEIQKNLDKQKAAAKGAADKQKEAADAVEASGQKAIAAAGNWLQIENAYTKASDTSKKYIENLKTLQAARDSEAAAMKAYADTYGTEKEKLEASSNAALEHEKALRALSEQVNADLEISKAKLASLEAERRVDGSLTEAKEKLREELEKTIVAKQAEADKTLQATSAAHSATLQAEASASVYADHAKQIYALRDAYQAAEAEYQRLAALNATGVNVAKELKTADEARAKALLLYRDALSDATAAAERHAVAERNAASLQQSALQNDLYRANTILEIAKQRGNEKEIAQAQIAVWRIELEISEAQAQASRLEAEAMLIVAKAKRAELEASGALTEAKKAELAVMDANIKAKQLEADKYDLIAARMKALSYETNELKSSFLELSSSSDQAATSADRAASSYDGLASSIRAAGQAKDGWGANTQGDAVVAGVNVPALAAKNTQTPDQARIFEEVFNYYFSKAMQDPVNYSSTQGLQIGAIERQATDAAAAEAQRRTKPSSAGATTRDTTTAGTPVVINLGTSKTRITVSSQSDASALAGLLSQLEAQKRVSA